MKIQKDKCGHSLHPDLTQYCRKAVSCSEYTKATPVTAGEISLRKATAKSPTASRMTADRESSRRESQRWSRYSVSKTYHEHSAVGEDTKLEGAKACNKGASFTSLFVFTISISWAINLSLRPNARICTAPWRVAAK
jgi:hypothetical protein